MIEIAVLFFGTKSLVKTAQTKGYPGAIAAIFPVFWIVGEVIGAVIGVVASGEVMVGMGIGLVFAIISGIVGAGIVHLLPARAAADDNADPFASLRDSPDAGEVQANVWAG